MLLRRKYVSAVTSPTPSLAVTAATSSVAADTKPPASSLADPAHAAPFAPYPAPADDEADSATQTDAGAISASAGDSRVYLWTPYGEREACEAWGGEWDPTYRSCFVPVRLDPAPFVEQWGERRDLTDRWQRWQVQTAQAEARYTQADAATALARATPAAAAPAEPVATKTAEAAHHDASASTAPAATTPAAATATTPAAITPSTAAIWPAASPADPSAAASSAATVAPAAAVTPPTSFTAVSANGAPVSASPVVAEATAAATAAATATAVASASATAAAAPPERGDAASWRARAPSGLPLDPPDEQMGAAALVALAATSPTAATIASPAAAVPSAEAGVAQPWACPLGLGGPLPSLETLMAGASASAAADDAERTWREKPTRSAESGGGTPRGR